MFGTTREFLDYFGLKKLDDLPPLADLSDWESLRVQLNLPEVEGQDGSEEFVLEDALDADSAADTPVLYSQGGVETSDEEELVISERSSPLG
jgi:segregation and condensation protein B